MNTRLITAAFAAVALSVTVLAPGALAQPGGRQQGRPGGPGFGGPPFGGGMAAFGGMNFGRVGQIVDPTRNAYTRLLRRDDVRNELLISSRQREQLEAVIGKDDGEFMNRMVQGAVQEAMTNPVTQRMMAEMQKRGAELRNLPPQERGPAMREMMQQFFNDPENRKQMEQMRNERVSQMQTFQADLDKKIASILSARQMQRLKQLDLQFRGGLALADTAVAEPFALAAEQKTEVDKLVQEFRLRQGNIWGGSNRNGANAGEEEGAGAAGRSGNAGSSRRAPFPGLRGSQEQTSSKIQDVEAGSTPILPPSNAAEFNARVDAAVKEADQSRFALGAKAIALLGPEQRQFWKQLQGRKFTFRPALITETEKK